MRRAARCSRSRLRRAALLAAVALAVVCLPAGLLDGAPSLCLIRAAGGTWCPGCGMSRALWHLAHGEVTTALAFNRLVVVIAPLLAWAALRWAWRAAPPPMRGTDSADR